MTHSNIDHLSLTNIASMLPHLIGIAYLKQEHVISLSLDMHYRLITKRTVFIGTLTGALIHPREIFADPVADHAFAVIVAHNHPSGHVTPSREDVATTRQLMAAGEVLGIPLHDHLIVAGSHHFSFRGASMLLPTASIAR